MMRSAGCFWGVASRVKEFGVGQENDGKAGDNDGLRALGQRWMGEKYGGPMTGCQEECNVWKGEVERLRSRRRDCASLGSRERGNGCGIGREGGRRRRDLLMLWKDRVAGVGEVWSSNAGCYSATLVTMR